MGQHRLKDEEWLPRGSKGPAKSDAGRQGGLWLGRQRTRVTAPGCRWGGESLAGVEKRSLAQASGGHGVI